MLFSRGNFFKNDNFFVTLHFATVFDLLIIFYESSEISTILNETSVSQFHVVNMLFDQYCFYEICFNRNIMVIGEFPCEISEDKTPQVKLSRIKKGLLVYHVFS